MNIDIFSCNEKRYALLKEEDYDKSLIDLLKVDYLILEKDLFYYDKVIKTYDKEKEVFSLESLFITFYNSKKQRFLVQNKQIDYQMFSNQENSYLVLDCPKILNKYQDSYLGKYYIVEFNKKYYLFLTKKRNNEYCNALKEKKKCHHFIMVSGEIETDGDYLSSLIIKEYLFDLMNKIQKKKLEMKSLFQKNLLIKIKDVKHLYKVIIEKKELAA